jgi:hypothetical protein
VIQRFKSGAWTIAQLICQQDNGEPRHPDDIKRYDGGEGDMGGQLAYDEVLGDTTYRLTGEMDLLLATVSPSELELSDWKSGWTWWTASDVADSFQLGCFYPALIFRNYPTCERLRVRVVMPSYAEITSPIVIDRKQVYGINGRIQTALRIFHEHRNAATPDAVPCHPSNERCGLCNCRQMCRLVKRTVTGLAETLEGRLEQLAATQAAADMLTESLTAHVRKSGQEIEFGNLRFGTERPKKKKAATCELYDAETK